MSPIPRFEEIDAWRGYALIAMIIYHFFYFLSFGEIISIDYQSNELPVLLLEAIGHFARNSFILLVGLSATLSIIKHRQIKKISFAKTWLHFFKRGGLVFASASLISIGSYIFIPEKFVYFGILHFIGLAIILAPPFLYTKTGNAFSLIILGTLAFFLDTITLSQNYLTLILGLTTPYSTIDYFPFLQWFPIVLLGGLAAHFLYKNYQPSKFINHLKPYIPKPNWITYLGQHTFSIYFIHLIILLLLTGLLQLILA